MKRKRTKFRKYSKWILFIAISIMTMGLLIDIMPAVLCSAFYIISYGIIFTFTETYFTTGFAIFHYNNIQFIVKTREEFFKIEELDDLKIKYFGFAGERYPNIKSIIPKDGTGNIISFSHKGQEYSYEFLLEESNIRNFKSIVNYWQNEGYNVTLIGEWGIKVKSL